MIDLGTATSRPPVEANGSSIGREIVRRWPYVPSAAVILIVYQTGFLAMTALQAATISLVSIVLIEVSLLSSRLIAVNRKLDRLERISTDAASTTMSAYFQPVTKVAERLACAVQLCQRSDHLRRSDSGQSSRATDADRLNQLALEELREAHAGLVQFAGSSLLTAVADELTTLDSETIKRALEEHRTTMVERIKAWEPWKLSVQNGFAVVRAFSEGWSRDLREIRNPAKMLRDVADQVQEMIDERQRPLPEERHSPALTTQIAGTVIGSLAVTAGSICIARYKCVFSPVIMPAVFLAFCVVQLIETVMTGK